MAGIFRDVVREEVWDWGSEEARHLTPTLGEVEVDYQDAATTSVTEQ